MDLVSIQKHGLAQKNESLTTGLTNGNDRRIESVHSGLMSFQRFWLKVLAKAPSPAGWTFL